MILLTLLEGRARHGYELVKSIEAQSQSRLQFHVASLYPMLYRLERQGLVEGCCTSGRAQKRGNKPREAIHVKYVLAKLARGCPTPSFQSHADHRSELQP